MMKGGRSHVRHDPAHGDSYGWWGLSGLNAVIRAAVKTAINEYGWEVLGSKMAFEGLIKPHKARLLDMTDVRGLLPRGGTMLGSTNRANPFITKSAPTGRSTSLMSPEAVLHRAQDYGIDGLLVIGGDGTMRIAQELMQKGAARGRGAQNH